MRIAMILPFAILVASSAVPTAALATARHPSGSRAAPRPSISPTHLDHGSASAANTTQHRVLRAHSGVVLLTAAQRATADDLRDLQFQGSGGGIQLAGGELEGHRVRAGRLHVFVDDGGGRSSTDWRVAGGLITLDDGHVHTVGAGTLHVVRHGRNGWLLSGGELSPPLFATTAAPNLGTTETADIDERDPIAPSDPPPLAATASAPVTANAHTAGPVELPGSELAALDELASLAPRGSRDAVLQASANEVTIHNAETPAPSVFDVPIIGHRVVLVIDTSYSMRDRDPDASDASIDPTAAPSKLDVARSELVRMLSALPPGTNVDIVAFSASAESLWPEPRAIDADSVHEAIRWVAALRPGDETDPISALQRAEAMHPDQIVFVSDGRPTDHDTGDAALDALAGTVASAGARLDIVGIGPDQDAAFLDRIAAHGNGIARHR